MLINTIWCAFDICGPATEWLVAIGTLLLGFVAFISIEEVRSWIFKPRIRPVEMKLVRTEQKHTKKDDNGIEKNETKTYHRLIVKNIWRFFGMSARDVRVLLTYDRCPPNNFIPIPLGWTYWGTFERDISRGEPAYLNVLEERKDDDGKKKYEFIWAKNVHGSGTAEGILKEYDSDYGNLRLEFFDRNGGRVGDVVLKYFASEDCFKVARQKNAI